MTTRHPRRRAAAALAAAALVLASCGGGDEVGADPTPTPGDTPATAEPESSPEAAGEPDTEPEPDGAVGATDSVEGDGDEPEPPAESADDPAPTAVRFTTPDGEELAGDLYGDGTRGVVLAHMRSRDRSTWDTFARAAAADGNHVLTFDFRGYGDSSGTRDQALDTDLLAAIDFLRSQGATQIVVAGASMGGTAAVNVASRTDLAGAISLSAPADFLGLPALAVAADVGEPLLIVTAEGDQPYADTAVELAELAPVSQLQILSGNRHGTNLFADHGDTLTTSMLDFIRARTG